MLEVFDLVKQYRKTRAVDGLSFEIRPGEIVGLLGPNGAGKTTALRCVAGILKPTAGAIRINGFDLETDQARAKQGLAFVPEMPSLYDLLTVDEHLRFIAMCFNQMDHYRERADRLLERYDLMEKKSELVATLSKGMRQKLAIACAFIRDANVLLFDEPVIGIDPAGVAEFKLEIQRAKAAGCCILVSTHLLDTAERLCDRVMIVARGRMLAQGTLQELRATGTNAGATLEEVFLRLTEERDETAPVFDL